MTQDLDPARDPFKVFLSAGIPEDDWHDASFQRHEIVEAVIATSRILLRAGADLVFGGHPLITPLIFEVAAGELVSTRRPERVVLFQSRHFADTLPPQVWSFREAPWASVHDIDGAAPERGDSDSTVLEKRAVALRAMREAMIGDFGPYTAAVLIGGKDGIRDEFERIKSRPEAVLCYPIRRPGGMARNLPLDDRIDDELSSRLWTSGAYTDLARRIVANITAAGSHGI